jgi:glycosyltransferase involved in cell wall biosynthesis
VAEEASDRGVPTVSVLVPCRNQERFVAETIASVQAQTFRDWELIVVDDGSSDRSAQIIRSEPAVRAVLIAADDPRHGASAARNRALALARGRYIQYLDADDVLLPDALASRVAALERTGADVAYADIQRLEENERGEFTRGALEARALRSFASRDDAAVVGGFWRPPAGLLYSRRIVDAIGPWREYLTVAEDARYTMDAALAGARFVHVPGVSALYRVTRAASLSRRDRGLFVRCVVRNSDEVLELWRQRAALDADCRRALAETYNYVARASFCNDGDLFAHAYAQLRAVGGDRLTGWPRIAATLSSALGKPAALRVLELCGRPAERWDTPAPAPR